MGAEPFLQYKGDYVIADVYMNFKECMTSFQLQAAKVNDGHRMSWGVVLGIKTPPLYLVL